ncbi:DUF3822 family protein [Gaoshiqia sediminis]|uniref:DUF3822 family protein n=1 Tax=Gaoshiqia sediminis TaxID=2986998 RepID=A0AA41Y965_9BACT|nr:DUF3822 family protein [Gaoshiqia sediminis]MCW0483253.1 DUF3822 family protein [Gaoshiqia sediminis]
MQNISLVDETFDLNFTPEYILSIQVSLDGFSFSILDSIQNKVVYLFHQDTFTNDPGFQLKKIKSVYQEADLLELPYKKTNLYYTAPEKTTLVPASLFQPEEAARLYQFTFNASGGEDILYTKLPQADSIAVFGIHHELHEFLKEKHPGIEIQNDLLVSLSDLSPGKNILKIRVFRKQLAIWAYDQQMRFYNSFYYEGETDQLYYILGAVNSMGSEPSTVILDGMVNKHAEIYHRLRQYFNTVQIAVNNKNLHYSYLIDRLPDARFANLFNSFSCVS